MTEAVTAGNGEVRIKVPAFNTRYKIYVVAVCGPHYATQFITAPFAKGDTLRATVTLSRTGDNGSATGVACDGKPDQLTRATVTDTSTFIGRAAATELEVSRMREAYASFSQPSTEADTARAVIYQHRIRRRLVQGIVRARSPLGRARAAHTLVTFAFWTKMPLDAGTRRRVRTALPADSKWWLTEPYIVGFGGTQLLFTPSVAGDPSELSKRPAARQQMESYLEKMVNALGEPEIQSEARSQLVRLAYMAGDTVGGQLVLAQMLAEEPNYPSTRRLASRYAPNRPIREGVPMPAFDFSSLPDTSNHVRNSDVAGKFTLIDFWGTWCGPCLGALPELHRIYKTYHPRGLEILSIAAETNPEVVKDFRKRKWPMPWLNAYAEYSEGVKDNPQLQRLGIVAFPRTVLIDPQGIIVASFGPGLEDLASTLDRVLPR